MRRARVVVGHRTIASRLPWPEAKPAPEIMVDSFGRRWRVLEGGLEEIEREGEK